MPQERDSNIELLRIVSMLMVLNVHTFWAPDNLQNLTIGGGGMRACYLIFSAKPHQSRASIFLC